MQVFSTKTGLQSYINSLDSTVYSIGMVPTMGALHSGHIALVQKALLDNDVVVVSIFVNPTQFNNKQDLDNYPNTLDKDIALLKGLSKAIIVFIPTVHEIYPKGVVSKIYNFKGLERIMEGEFREGHFNGVATVVEALLRLVMPTRAYFGEKDFQQLLIVRRLITLTNLPIEVIGCPIVRHSSGLAMSSRNKRLSKALKNEAPFIYKTLVKVKEKFGSESAKHITDWVNNQFKTHPSLQLEYIQITDVEYLKPVIRKQKNKSYRAFLAVYAEDIRLIDNIAL